MTQSPTPPFPHCGVGGPRRTLTWPQQPALHRPQQDSARRHQLPCRVRARKLPPAGKRGGGQLAVHQLECQGPQRGVCLGPGQEPPTPMPESWSTSSPGSHTEGPLDPPAPARAPPSWTGALTQHRPACRVSSRTAQRGTGRPYGLQAACQLRCHQPRCQGRVPRQTGKGQSWWGKGPKCRKRFLLTEPRLERRAHSGKAWLLAHCCSKPSAPATPRWPPAPYGHPLLVSIWPAEF